MSVADALDSVAGYTICNDLTTRSLVPRTDIPMMGTDWLRAKNFPTFYPTGPWLVPARFVPDPLDLGIRLSLNGTTMQKSNTGDMIFGPAQLISYISRYATLQPGRHGHHRIPAGKRLALGPLPAARRRPGVRRSTAWACSAPAASPRRTANRRKPVMTILLDDGTVQSVFDWNPAIAAHPRRLRGCRRRGPLSRPGSSRGAAATSCACSAAYRATAA